MARPGNESQPDYPARHRLEYAIWNNSELSSKERLVLLAYAWHVNQPHGLDLVWLSRSRLRKMTGLGNDQLAATIRKLEAGGCLVLVKKGGGKASSRYRIVPPSVPDGRNANDMASVPDGRNASPVPSVPDFDVSVPVSSRSVPDGRNRTKEHKELTPLPPTPENPRAQVTEKLKAKGVEDPAEREWLTNHLLDPATGTRSPLARLDTPWLDDARKRYREHQQHEKRRERDTAPKCDECSRTISECDQAGPDWCNAAAARAGVTP